MEYASRPGTFTTRAYRASGADTSQIYYRASGDHEGERVFGAGAPVWPTPPAAGSPRQGDERRARKVLLEDAGKSGRGQTCRRPPAILSGHDARHPGAVNLPRRACPRGQTGAPAPNTR